MVDGKRLRILRNLDGLSADQLARLLQMSKSQLLRYEQGKADMTTAVMVRFARYFGVSADYLLGFTDDPPVRSVDGLTDHETALLIAMRRKRFIEAVQILYDSLEEHC